MTVATGGVKTEGRPRSGEARDAEPPADRRCRQRIAALVRGSVARTCSGSLHEGLFFGSVERRDIVSPSRSMSQVSLRDRAVEPRAARWKFWLWRPINQRVARSNARGASIALAEQRIEREDANDFVTRLAAERQSPR